MAAVHAAIRLVSPIETTIHSGEIIALLPGKSGTINFFLNSEIRKEKNTNSAHFDSFFESFGDEFKGQKAFVKPVLIRTGAHFRFRGDKQFVTVVYSGSGRMVFNFDSDSHTNPMQKLYVEDQPGGLVVTNRDGGNNLHLAYSLFDIPACTSEIQTDILVDLSLVTPLGSAPSSPSPSPPSLKDDEQKILANYFLSYANEARKKNGPDGNIDDVIQELKDNNLLQDEEEETFIKDIQTEFDFGKDGYDIYDEQTKHLKHISIDKYKQKLDEIRDLTPNEVVSRLKTYFTNEQIRVIKKVTPGKIALAQKELNLPKSCIPQEDSFWKSPDQDQESMLKNKIENCDQMRVPEGGGAT